ncbi:MAG: hypothetical protein DDT26_02433 [Dehalococcoidia bacterium]|nr:hypothetical protein [Chloroflexota bacterium]
MGGKALTLPAALAAGKLDEFITQAEAAGYGFADRAEFDALLGKMLTAPLPADQTSRSRGSGGSRGK